jgi:hypothetical protein
MRKILIVALLCAGCSSPTPLAPSTASASPPVVAPPVVPPAPTFPVVSGTWTGTYAETDSAVTPNYSLTVVCGATWNVFAQTAGTFTGDLLLSGSSQGINCSGGLRLTGSVSQTGVLTIDRAWPYDDAHCALKTTENLHGALTGSAVTINQKDSWSCPPYLIARTILIQVTKS